MSIKKLLLFILFSSFSFFAFCQNEETEATESAEVDEKTDGNVNLKGKDYKVAENFNEFIASVDYVLDFGPAIYVNNKSKLASAPSPAYFPISMGVLWPNYTFVAMQPSVSVSYMYYLWHDGMALPAEIENRTAMSINILANLPAMFQFYLKDSRVQVMAGLAFMGRIGFLAQGVSENDSGESGTAGGDLALINNWFWSGGRFLYLSTGASWIFNLNEEGTLKAGPELKIYLPVGGIISQEGLQGMIITIGMKILL